MSTPAIIRKALAYYDGIMHRYRSHMRRIDGHKYHRSRSAKMDNYLNFYDKRGELLGSSKYQSLGVYSPQNRLWVWAWSIPTNVPGEFALARSLLTYGLDNEDANIRNELVNSRFSIRHEVSLDIHIALAAYLTQRVIYAVRSTVDPEDRSNYIVEYVFLTDFDPKEPPMNWGGQGSRDLAALAEHEDDREEEEQQLELPPFLKSTTGRGSE